MRSRRLTAARGFALLHRLKGAIEGSSGSLGVHRVMTIGGAAKAFRVLLTPTTLLLLFACADTERAPPAQAQIGTSRLFTRAYDEIMNFYIAPLASKDLAVSALRRLSTLDP